MNKLTILIILIIIGGFFWYQQKEPAVIEIDLLKDLKLRRFSMEAISALAANSGFAPLH